MSEKEIFEGVDYEKFPYESRGNVANLILIHKNKHSKNERDSNFKRFMKNLENIYAQNPEICSKSEEEFYELLSSFKFLPNSPTLMNAGRELHQLSACYVLPVEDSIEGIYTALKDMALIHQSGGGTGFSFSRLRPEGEFVKTTKGVSSGPVSFMGIFDKSTEIVKQGGTRRGANMGILHYTHPDILKFIEAKKTPGVLENFNISVTIDNKFMQAVKESKDYELINPKDNSVAGKLNAREVWDKLVKSAWETGDPGILFIDRINNTESNPTPHIGEIESTNPCGEQPLLPYEPCNLGSLNLYKFVKEDGSDFNYDELKRAVFIATHFLDNVIDVNNYPIPEIEKMAKTNRRIGLGVMGWAESLVKLGLPYNSEEARKKAEEVMEFINVSCLKASEKLAEERGIFPSWKGSIYDRDSKYFKGQEYYPRNSARTTIAPTGTIGIAAGLQGAGIEPFFAVAYTRYNAKGLDALKKGEEPKKEDTFFEVNPLFEEIAKKENYFGIAREELYKKIDKNHKSLKGIKEIPERIQKLFLTAHDLTPEDHILMQCAFQRHTNNAVSKTVNLKNEATVEDVEKVYLLAYEKGAKGVTIYRDGSKQFQVLNTEEKTKEKKKEKLEEFADYHMIRTGYGPLHVHINYTKEGPTKVFASIPPIGTEISGLTSALSIVLSKYLELGGDPVRILKHLNSVKSERPFGFGKNKIDSIPHGISVALRRTLVKIGKIPLNANHQIIKSELVNNSESLTEKISEEKSLYCPKCFSSNVGMMSGCSEPTCFDCGYSKCS